jgi:hypothetical protein
MHGGHVGILRSETEKISQPNCYQSSPVKERKLLYSFEQLAESLREDMPNQESCMDLLFVLVSRYSCQVQL